MTWSSQTTVALTLTVGRVGRCTESLHSLTNTRGKEERYGGHVGGCALWQCGNGMWHALLLPQPSSMMLRLLGIKSSKSRAVVDELLDLQAGGGRGEEGEGKRGRGGRGRGGEGGEEAEGRRDGSRIGGKGKERRVMTFHSVLCSG